MSASNWLFKESDLNLKDLQKKMDESYWIPEQIDMSRDEDFWIKMNDDEKSCIRNALAEFIVFDTRIQSQLIQQFLSEIEDKQVGALYATQTGQESIHQRSYSQQFLKLMSEDDLINSVENNKIMNEKVDWYNNNMVPSINHSERILVNACVENIFFCGKFCLIYWFKIRGLLPGVTSANEYISKDEANHVLVALAYYHKLGDKVNDANIIRIIKEATELECNSILINQPSLPGLSRESMCKYIKHCANHLYYQITNNNTLIYPEVKECPFEWMIAMTLPYRTNFFELHPTQYKTNAIKITMAVDDDF